MKLKAFTLAEVLLTLAVIGIVAAITLPSLMVDTAEKAFDAQRAALHARLTQAIGMMANLSGYGEYTANETGDTLTDTAAENFLYEGLSKVYKMNNICASGDSSDVLDKCNLPSKITTMNNAEKDFPTTIKELNPLLIAEGESPSDVSKTNTKIAAFETVNGESIAVFYNPNCRSDAQTGVNLDEYGSHFYTQNRMCANFVYDLNGLKGPNKVGKDIGFITALYDKNPEVVAPMPYTADVDDALHSQQEAVNKCANYADNSRLPNRHELSSMFYNMELVGGYKPSNYWSGSISSSSEGWIQGFFLGTRYTRPYSHTFYARCIRK